MAIKKRLVRHKVKPRPRKKLKSSNGPMTKQRKHIELCETLYNRLQQHDKSVVKELCEIVGCDIVSDNQQYLSSYLLSKYYYDIQTGPHVNGYVVKQTRITFLKTAQPQQQMVAVITSPSLSEAVILAHIRASKYTGSLK